MSNKFFERKYQLENGVEFQVTAADGAETDVRRAIGDIQTELQNQARLENVYHINTTWNTGAPLASISYKITKNPF